MTTIIMNIQKTHQGKMIISSKIVLSTKEIQLIILFSIFHHGWLFIGQERLNNLQR